MIINFEQLYNRSNLSEDLIEARRKFAEIVDAVGIDPRILKRVPDEDVDSSRTGKVPWQIPEESADFVVDIIRNYTSPDYKNLRKGDSHLVSAETLQKIIDGFSAIMSGLGCDGKTIASQTEAMKYRLNFELARAFADYKATVELMNDKLSVYRENVHRPGRLNKIDLPFLIDDVTRRVKMLLDDTSDVYEAFSDLRNEELIDLAAEDAEDMDDAQELERINQDLALMDALEKDSEYIEAQKTADKLVKSGNYVAKIKKPYEAAVSKMEFIRRSYEIKLFGAPLPEEPEKPLVLTHPRIMLAKAIDDVLEERELRKKWEEERKNLPSISPNDLEHIRKKLMENADGSIISK